MSEITLGTITSTPDADGNHRLQCPSCDATFLQSITKDRTTGALNKIECPICRHADNPKSFIAAAHREEVKNMAAGYVAEELSKAFKGIKK